jgi:hypothetical protein
VGGRGFQSLGDNPLHRHIRHRARGPEAWFIQQPIKAVGHHALPPFADRVRRHPPSTGDGKIRLPLSTRQNNPGPLRQRLSGFRAACPLLQGLPFRRRHHQRGVGRPVRMVSSYDWLQGKSLNLGKSANTHLFLRVWEMVLSNFLAVAMIALPVPRRVLRLS